MARGEPWLLSSAIHLERPATSMKPAQDPKPGKTDVHADTLHFSFICRDLQISRFLDSQIHGCKLWLAAPGPGPDAEPGPDIIFFMKIV